ncbi:MAG: hypothetical protein IJ811_00620 [Clostridia bacterium]|nr:hypothetical protein [Clostridia bacterium]
MLTPISDTNAFRIIQNDKASGQLSHAYLIACSDEAMAGEYLIELSKLIVCDDYYSSFGTRVATLIEKREHPDVTFYPKEKKLTVACADELVAQSVVKPMELPIRLFIVSKVEELAQYQNKLLKTLEEPPKNVVILMSTVNENAVLPTIKSRSKRLSVPLFSEEKLFSALSPDHPDGDRLSISVALAGGQMGEAIRYYEWQYTPQLFEFCLDVIGKMNTAADVIFYQAKMKDYPLIDVITGLKVVCHKCLTGNERNYRQIKQKFRPAVFIGIIDKLGTIEKSINFNANNSMATDRILFSVMEEKAKWQRL